MKQLFLCLILINANMMQAQTNNDFAAEEFLAEVFYGNMTEKSPKTYLVNNSSSDYGLIMFYKEKTYKRFCKELNICDTTIVDELIVDYYRNDSCSHGWKWNENAPVFQSSKYKNLIFVANNFELSKRERKKVEQRRFSKPLFTKNHEYALVNRTYYSIHKYSWRYRWANFPRRNFWKAQYKLDIAGYNVLYKKIDSKWVEIGRYLTENS